MINVTYSAIFVEESEHDSEDNDDACRSTQRVNLAHSTRIPSMQGVDTKNDSQVTGHRLSHGGQKEGPSPNTGRGRSRGRKRTYGSRCGQEYHIGGCECSSSDVTSSSRSQSKQKKINRKRSGNECTTKKHENKVCVINFSGNIPGPSGEAHGIGDPFTCSDLFMSEYYDKLLQHRNLYATQQRAASADTRPWTPIAKEELVALIGFNIAMGVISLPSLHEYWSTDVI